jgi:hypothetical protein
MLLKKAIQTSDPFMSKKSIEVGSRWLIEIGKQLDESTVGIVCMTKENQTAPWLNFEAGAISNAARSSPEQTNEKIESRVCLYRIDLDQADVGWPLAMFQDIVADRDGTKEVVRMVNRRVPVPLSDADLDDTFSHFWPDFETQLNAAKKLSGTPAPPSRSKMEENMDEVLSTMRRIERKAVEAENRASLFPAGLGSPAGLSSIGAVLPSMYGPPDYLGAKPFSASAYVITPDQRLPGRRILEDQRPAEAKVEAPRDTKKPESAGKKD